MTSSLVTVVSVVVGERYSSTGFGKGGSTSSDISSPVFSESFSSSGSGIVAILCTRVFLEVIDLLFLGFDGCDGSSGGMRRVPTEGCMRANLSCPGSSSSRALSICRRMKLKYSRQELHFRLNLATSSVNISHSRENPTRFICVCISFTRPCSG